MDSGRRHPPTHDVTAETLMRDAERSTGLSDWGGNATFVSGLRVLLASLAESSLPLEARQRQIERCRDHLEVRLRLIDHRTRHPETAARDVDGPLVVMGLPRTGTTALIDLLVQVPAARAILQWETNALFPPPRREQWATDPRIASTQRHLDRVALAFPELVEMHAFGAELPQECNAVLELEFWSPNVSGGGGLDRYADWLAHNVPENPFPIHRWVLQHLQAHGPSGRWTLKSPFHMFDLPAFLAVYRSAVFVQTHRDPAAVAPLPRRGGVCGARPVVQRRGTTGRGPR